MKAKVSALMAGFIREIDGASGMAADATKTDPATLTLEPGTLRVLPPGTDITFTPTADMSTICDLLRYMQRSVAAGGGVTYEALTGDLSQVNFSSARLGMAQFQRRIKALQASMLGAQLLAPIWRRWVLLEILSGRIAAPDFQSNPMAYLNCKFLWPGFPAVDPLKQAKADALDLASRTRSRAEIAADHGRDISDIDQEIESDPLFVSDPVAAAALLAQPEDPQNANQ
jgi:lambda family phage portal protein